MTWERAGRLAWIAPVAIAALDVAYFVIADYPDDGAEGVDFLFTLAFLTYGAVGALIAAGRPRNPVGWLFCAVGLYFAGSEALYAYARDPSEPPGAQAAAWLYTWASDPAAVIVVLLVLLFPTGRFLTRRWRLAGLAAVGASVAWAAALAFAPGPLGPVEAIENPLGIDGAAGILAPVVTAGQGVLVAGILVAVCGAIVRFRRARARERRQLKWLAFAAGFAVAVLIATTLLLLLTDTDRGAADFLSALLFCSGIAALPVAAAIAILHERLYDIDVVIRRTLVYGALTAILAATYLGSVLLVGLAVGESDLAVAASTLAVAALFGPARSGVQRAVDRRFYRRRYDAARTQAAFGARLRDEIDLERVGVDLRGVVAQTMQPAHVSLWLRAER